MSHPPVKVGLVGAGNISGIYLKNARRFGYEVVACADLDLERARAQATEHGVARACTPDELFAMDEVELVLNLTVPAAHAEVGRFALASGKHLYGEKPLATERAAAAGVLELAAERGLRIGCAPDTFLGAGLQTCRRLVDGGAIGEPVGATAFMMSNGPEGWHPSPDFFYAPGGGPLLDMGPYYITALVSLLGPVRSVTGAARASFPTRTIGSGERRGERVPVGTPTHVAGLLELDSGPIASLVMSFDVQASTLPRIEVYGSEGTLLVPDPNTFGGPVRLRAAGEAEWREVPLDAGHAENSRGLGLADMAAALGEDRPHRASGALAYHVLDTMQAILESAESGHRVTLTSGLPRPEPLPMGFAG